MDRNTRFLLIAIGAVLALAIVALAAPYFLPESTTTHDEGLPEGGTMSDGGAMMHDNSSMDDGSMMSEGEPTVLKLGTFSGRAGHHSEGVVKIVEIDGAHYLRFEDYEETAGPDVYVYLTPSSTPDTREEIEAGVKILIDGVEGGENTKRGTFNQLLPDGLDLSLFNGVGTWCERFAVPFGAASLTAPA